MRTISKQKICNIFLSTIPKIKHFILAFQKLESEVVQTCKSKNWVACLSGRTVHVVPDQC